MDTPKASYMFRGFDDYAGSCTGKTCQFTWVHWKDGGGTVTVEMPHASSAGRAKFSA